MFSFISRFIFGAVFWSFTVFGLFAETSISDDYQDMRKGEIGAKITIIEYASFTCPHCATFHKEVFPKIEKEYIDTGKVNFIYREVYFDAPGLWAGLLARCSNPKSYFGIVDLLYNRQNSWAKGSSDKEILSGLFAIGRQLGLKENKITECLQNEKKALGLVRAYQEHAKMDSISSTPSLVINGKLFGNLSYSDIKIELDRLLNL